MVEIIKSYSITVDKGELEIILLGLDELKGTGFDSTIMDTMRKDLEANI